MIPRAEATRQRIIETAAELMGARGYGRTGLEAILDRSGVSRGNFYHHFQSKEDLGFAVLDHIGARFRAFLRTSMADVDDPCERIDAMLDALVRHADCRGGCPLGNLAAEMSDVNEAFRARLEGIFGAWREMVAGTLGEAASDGVDVDGLARYVICCVEGSILMAKVTREAREVDNALTHLKAHLRRRLPASAA